MKIGILIYFLAFALSAYGKSLEWQKLELEKTINEQYENALGSLLKRNEFFIRTEVKYNDPGMPNFEDLNQDSFKVSDIAFDDSKEDYIAFSKVGLEVPVLGKAFQENQRKLKEMYRYNESFDLFKNIQSVEVTVNLSEALGQGKVALVQNVIDNFKISVGNFTPSVKINKVKIQGEAKGAVPVSDDGLGAREILEFLGRFGNALGMILTVLILGFLASKLLKMYMDFMERLKAMESAAGHKDEPQKENEDEERLPASMQAGSSTPSECEEVVASFERFEKLVKLNPQQAIILVKKWLMSQGPDSSLALGAIAQQLENELLDSIFDGLNIQEREKWTNNIPGYLEGAKLEKANKIVSEAVIKDLIGGSFISDYEIVDMILSMDMESVKEYVVGNAKYGKVLANLINPSLISELFEDLEESELDRIISESLAVDMAEVEKDLAGFKESLRENTKSETMKPFNYKLLQVVSGVSAEKESMLYQFMAKDTKKSEIVAVASQNLPSELVFKLPESFLKVTMQNYPMEKKISLLASLGEARRDFLISSFTLEGSNAREMILMELETVQEDELASKRIQNKKEEIWKEFVTFVRSSIANTASIKVEVEQIVSDWADGLKGAEAVA